MASTVILQGMQSAKKIVMGGWPWIMFFREKNRTQKEQEVWEF
jgi:hypothetical protein